MPNNMNIHNNYLKIEEESFIGQDCVCTWHMTSASYLNKQLFHRWFNVEGCAWEFIPYH